MSCDAEDLAPSDSLTPADRVIPSWTDPTVRRAATAIGGPLGNHASVGRNRFLTPMRVALAMAVAVLICGWLFKSPCIQQGPSGGLDQSGQTPWITGCYNDVVPLYGARGLDNPERNPYAYMWVERPNGETGRVYPADEVTDEDGNFFAADAGEKTGVVEHDLIKTGDGTFEQVSGDELVPVDPGDIGTLHHMEYPVLTGYFMWGAAGLTHAYLSFAADTGLLPQSMDVAVYFTIGAIALGLLYLWSVASTMRMAGRRVWDTAIMSLAPLLALHAFTNWDLIAIAFTAAGMAAWARQRSPGGAALAGVMFGLGTAAKLYPVLLLGPLLVLCIRSGHLRRFFWTAGATVVTWLAVNLPVMVAYPDAWREFFAMNTERGPEWDSWYFLSTVLTPFNPWSDSATQATTVLNVVSFVLFAVACALIGWLALAAANRPRFAQLAFLVVAAFLLTNKVWSPQYSLWLLPLVALALPRWRVLVSWQCVEVLVWFFLMFSFDSDTTKNLSIHPFVVAAIARDVLIIYMVVRVVREILRPELDLIRQAGDDDPSGGVFDGAADRWTLPGPKERPLGPKDRPPVPNSRQTEQESSIVAPVDGENAAGQGPGPGLVD